MELLPNLHWIEGRASNIYLWAGEAGLIMVDCGLPGDAKKILAYIQKIGRQPADIKTILITHADVDHAGAAAEIQQQSQAPILVSQQTAGWLIKGKSPPHMPRLIQFLSDRFFGYRPPAEEAVTIIDESQPLPEGLDGWQVLATPGHTNDHHSFFYQAEGILFTGDALNSRGGTLNLTEKRITIDLPAARQSARRLLRLNPSIIASGHGRPLQEHSADDLFRLYRELEAASAT